MSKHVTFDIAKLLKEKGFDIITSCRYNLQGEFLDASQLLDNLDKFESFNDWLKHKDEILYKCPDISDVVDWLLEKHNIWISVKKTNGLNKWFPQIYRGDDLIISEIITNSPKEAYLSAIEHTLKI